MTTMRYKASEIRHYNFTAQDKLFLDANIWLYLYGPPKLFYHNTAQSRLNIKLFTPKPQYPVISTF